MIKVTRLDGSELIVNSDLIEFIQSTPDTVISLTSGKKIVVVESSEEVVAKVIDFKRRVFERMNMAIGWQ